MSSRRKKSSDKKKHMEVKEFYTLISPEYFGEAEIGMTPAKTPEHVISRVVEITLSDLTNDFSQMHVKLIFLRLENHFLRSFSVKKLENSGISFIYTRDDLRSLVRRLTTRIDGIYNITTKDGYVLRITALVFTEHRISHKQKYSIRKIIKEILEEESAKLNFNEFVCDLVYGKTASKIYKKSKEIVPIRRAEILKSKLLVEPNTNAS